MSVPISSSNNSHSASQSNSNHSAAPQPQLPSSEPPSEEEYVRVLFDYDHKPKDGKKGQPYSIKKGDMLRLIERTNAEWWKVRPEGKFSYDIFSYFIAMIVLKLSC